MDSSTPKRTYYLRSTDRAAQAFPTPKKPSSTATDKNVRISLRKRNTPTEGGRGQKRQRTLQSHGPPFKSPECINPPKKTVNEEQRVIVSLPARMSLEMETPFGNFGKLPTDVVFQILTRTPYTLLGRMSMTSTSWNRTVVSYMKTGSFRLRWITDIENSQDSFNNVTPGSDSLYFAMGALIKFITANDKWSTRLHCLRTFLALSYEVGAPIAGLGKMINAFAIRPDEEVMMDQIDDIVDMVFSVVGSLKDELNSVLVRPDVERQLENRDNLHVWFYEIELRRRTLALFLNNGTADPALGLNKYFLSSLMKIFKDLRGAMPTALFYLLFSPTIFHENEEVIDFHRLSQISVLDMEDTVELKQFTRAIYALLRCKQLNNSVPWSKNTVFNLMEEITTYPNPWSMNTFVSLHVLEPELVPIGVVARMNRNHEDEAGDMICTMKMLLHRWNMDVQGVMENAIEAIKAALCPIQRRTLFDRCWDWHQRNIDDLRVRFGPYSDIRAEIESQIEVMPVLMKLL
ncbi:CRE-PROM-1 protein [Caenorhabditis remanei]|uniref:CRE-PROM-1 protein n=2 Tax=Caenorhabditis remanei TaxID=31234 RepID=E3MFI1_CAERE|nr:CRE-PROM-1 protein [Caenorhabditis remanei]